MNHVTIRTWILAARPKTLWAAVAPVLIGTAMALGEDVFHAPSAVAALLGGLLIQVGTNFANDYYDFQKGADTAERKGPLRATQAGLVTPNAMKRAMWITFFLVLAVSGYLVLRGGWPIAVLAVISIACGIWYTAGPYPLGYLGLGDLFVLVFFGPVAVAGTYFVQALTLNWTVVVAGLAPGLLSVAVLVVNNLRDVEEDRAAGKKTLAVRFGKTFARAEYTLSILLAVLIAVVLVVITGEHKLALLTLVILPLAIPGFRGVLGQAQGTQLNPVLASTARLLLVYSVLFSIGWVIGA